MNNNAYKLVLIAVILNAGLQVHAGLNAYSNDMKKCLFSNWPAGTTDAVLLGDVSCDGSQLCYSVSGSDPALFAVCYNTATRIPYFTAHVVKPKIGGGGRSGTWHDEAGTYAPNPQSSTANYLSASQIGLYPNYKDKQQIISRGHLVANADFSDDNEKNLTFVNTNIAPQWQPFNGENWAKIEGAVRNYATSVNRNVYVFTGTGGQAKRQDNNADIKLATNVVAPKYFWKVVCDPIAKGSIVFVGENSIGEIDVTNKVKGCNGKEQTKMEGVVYCYSLQAAQTSFASEGFKLPPLGPNCAPSAKAAFMDSYINVD